MYKQLLGTTIGGYTIERILGRGGMGIVFGGKQISLNRTVAIKMLYPHLCENKDILRRFKKEAFILANLEHPNIAHIYDIVEYNDNSFIIMQYIDGMDLKKYYNQASLSIKASLNVLIQVANGLSFAHQQQIIHRDIKSANIMLRKDPTGLRAFVMDFGIAHINQGQQMTDPGLITGTAEFMSPEQALGQSVNERSDIYSLGIVAFFLLTGRLPFEGAPLEVIRKQIHEPCPKPSRFNPKISARLDRLVTKALEKNNTDRYANMRSFQAALEGYQMNNNKAASSGPRSVKHSSQQSSTPAQGDQSTQPLTEPSASSWSNFQGSEEPTLPPESHEQSSSQKLPQPISPDGAVSREPAPAGEESTDKFLMTDWERECLQSGQAEPASPPLRSTPAEPVAAPATPDKPDEEPADDVNRGKLLIKLGGVAAQNIILTREETLIGNGYLNDIRIKNYTGPDFQFKIVATWAGHRLINTAKNSPVFINGQKIAVHYLKNDDEVKVGNVTMCYQEKKSRPTKIYMGVLGLGALLLLIFVMSGYLGQGYKSNLVHLDRQFQKITINSYSQSFYHPVRCHYKVILKDPKNPGPFQVTVKYVTMNNKLKSEPEDQELDPQNVADFITTLNRFKPSYFQARWAALKNWLKIAGKSRTVQGSTYYAVKIRLADDVGDYYTISSSTPGEHIWKLNIESKGAVFDVWSDSFMVSLHALIVKLDDQLAKKNLELQSQDIVNTPFLVKLLDEQGGQ